MLFTDVCTSDQLPEIELVSILTESLPSYKLRANTITDFSSYNTQDWGVAQPPLIQAQDLQLSLEQISEVFKYFCKLKLRCDSSADAVLFSKLVCIHVVKDHLYFPERCTL